MNIIRRNAANAVTCINLIAGCVAIVFSFSPETDFAGLSGLQWSWIAIAIAAVADFLDGFTARLLHAYSELGKQLDSLSDLVSFGVAPAMMVLNLLRLSPDAPAWLCWAALLIPVAGALRLARFNIDDRQTTSFIGLPIPANAIFWIGYTALATQFAPSLLSAWWFIPVVIAECWLMVSPLAIFSLKFKNYRLKGNLRRYILVVVALVLIICTGVPGLLYTIIIYLLLAAPYREK